MVLPLRIRPKASEPIHSTAQRLATRHGAPTVDYFLRPFGLSFEAIMTGTGAFQLLAMAGLATVHGEKAAPRIDARERSVQIGGQLLLLNDWSTSARRWCPLCFRDDRNVALSLGEPVDTACWHRISWDMRSTSSCANHQVALAATCFRCGRQQDWEGPTLDRCQCGGDLGEMNVRSLAPGEGVCDAYVQGRLGEASSLSLPLLDGDPLKHALPSVERLGWAVLLGYCPHRSRSTQEARVVARDAGIAVLDNWPSGFIGALDRVSHGRAAGFRSPGLIGAYGWIHSEWAYLPPRTALDRAVRSVLRSHAIRHHIIARGEPIYEILAPDQVNMTEAARILHMDYIRARDLLDDQGAIPTGVRRGVAFPIYPEDLNRVLGKRVAVRPAPAPVRLGVGKKQAQSLKKAFCKTDCSEGDWVQQLLNDCRNSKVQACDDPISLRRLPSACRSVGVSIVAACAALCSGQLTARGILDDDPTLAGILLQPSELRKCLGRSAMSIEAAACQLRIHHEAMRWLLKEGHIAKTSQGGVDRASVEAFAGIYIPASELARVSRTSSRHLVQQLAGMGVCPAFGPPACRQLILARSTVGLGERNEGALH